MSYYTSYYYRQKEFQQQSHKEYQQEFHKNWRINPETGRSIKPGGPTFQELSQKYGIPFKYMLELKQQKLPILNDFDQKNYTYINFGLSGVRDMDQKILFQLDLKTIINLHATNKSIKLLVEELLPDLLRIHNPTNDDNIIIYQFALDIVEVCNLELLTLLLNIFKRENNYNYSSLDYIKHTLKFLNQNNVSKMRKYYDSELIKIAKENEKIDKKTIITTIATIKDNINTKESNL